jgi:ubiquinone/menaquinone biosynthesis C-methylase UbiE
MSSFDEMAAFASVDRANDPSIFIRTLELAREVPGIAASRAKIMDGLRMAEGHTVLDVGCGIGYDSLLFGERVGPTGRVIGIDLSEIMLAEARRRAGGLGLPVFYASGDASHLDFPDDTFDSCRCERVLEYVPDVDQVLSEMIRVTRPGGRVGVFATDFGSVVVDHPDIETTDRILRMLAGSFPQGLVGRTMLRRFREHGLSEIEMSIESLLFTFPVLEIILGGTLLAAEERGDFTREELNAWWDSLRAAEKAGCLMAGMSAFIVAGTKPLVAV